MDNFNLGRAWINLKTAIAGSYRTIHYTYEAGHPVDDTGCVRIAFRSVGDFGTPQFNNPREANYCTVTTSGNCQIEPRWDPKGNTRPWGPSIYLKVKGGYLDKGERVSVLFGNTRAGSPGWQIQTFCEDSFEFKTSVDPIATYQFKELPKSPELRTLPGKAVRAVCVAPSQVRTAQRFDYYVKREDRWGNPASRPRKYHHSGFETAGVKTVRSKATAGCPAAESNPIRVVEAATTLHPYWADFHGQSEETVGSNTIDDYFNFARHYGLLDIAAHQGNDFQITDAFWDRVNRTTKSQYRPGKFVTFPGYEWSGNTPLGGDRNIYFEREGGHIARSCVDLLPGGKTQYPSAPNAGQLFRNLKSQKGPRAFGFAHVGGRYADMDFHDKEVEVAMEIHSAWGTFEWLVADALAHGYRVGICANSDGHKCRPGASYPGAGSFGSLGGLTCVLAEKLDRKHVADALFRRHFYATTGIRCLVDLKISTATGKTAMMGDILPLGSQGAELRVNVAGTTPIERVDVFNGNRRIRSLYAYSTRELGRRVKVLWSGAEVRGRGRKSAWHGRLQVKGNRISKIQPINFWNPNMLPRKVSPTAVEWKSITTGGSNGVILTLARPNAGKIGIDTTQKAFACELSSLGVRPKTWKCGGVGKQIELSRLPDRRKGCEFAFSLPLHNLKKGDNPVYVRVVQEDGHMAWTSPVYLTR